MTDSILTVSPINVVEKTTPMEGIWTWRNPRNGFRVIDLKFIADPRKRSEEWLLAAKAGIPSAEFEREHGDKWIVYDGKPVYGSDFNELDNGHVIKGAIVATRRAKLISGIDAGPTDLNLAWCLGLVFPQESRITFIDEYYTDDGDVNDFLQIVNSRLKMEWNKLGGFSLFFCDASVNTPGGPDKRSIAQAMRLMGMTPQIGEITWAGRKKSMFEVLKEYKNGRPRFLVHERCELIIEAMKGGYHYGKLPMVTAGGMYKELPTKNKYSHIMNAVEYAVSRINAASADIPYEGRRLPMISVV